MYRNGVADRVTVVHKSSRELQLGVDVPARGVDVIVTELVDSGLLGERILPVLHDVRSRGVLAPGGRVVPEVQYAAGWTVSVLCCLRVLNNVLANPRRKDGTQLRVWCPPSTTNTVAKCEPLSKYLRLLDCGKLQ